MSELFFVTASDLSALGPDVIPDDFIPAKKLIFSSPATLAYNSPGASGFGVKRAGLVIPESVMLVVSPQCCGRNSTVLGAEGGYADRIFYLNMDGTDLVTGRHLELIPQAVEEILNVPAVRPKVVLICITCVDALLGTDLERVCRKAEQKTGVRVVPSYMYALTREGTKPPMSYIRKSIYSILEKREKKPAAMNILGFFSPLSDDNEIYTMFPKAGINIINEISRMETYEECLAMGEANFNLVLNPEAGFAAQFLAGKLEIPYVCLLRSYDIFTIRKQYNMLSKILDVEFEQERYYNETSAMAECLKKRHGGLNVLVGQALNANPFELSCALSGYGLNVAAIFSNYSTADHVFVKSLSVVSPDTRIYSGISPSMAGFEPLEGIDLTIGQDAAYYAPYAPNLSFCGDVQPFGYAGLRSLINGINQTMGGAS